MFSMLLLTSLTMPGAPPTVEAVKGTVEQIVRKEEAVSSHLTKIRGDFAKVAAFQDEPKAIRLLLRELQAEIAKAKDENKSLRRDLQDLPGVLGLLAKSYSDRAAQYPEGIFRDHALQLAAEVETQSQKLSDRAKSLQAAEEDLKELEPFLEYLGFSLDDDIGYFDVMGKLEVPDTRQRYLDRLKSLRERFDKFRDSLERDHDSLRSEALSTALRNQHRQELLVRQPRSPQSMPPDVKQVYQPTVSRERPKGAPPPQRTEIVQTGATPPLVGVVQQPRGNDAPPRQIAPGLWNKPPKGSLVYNPQTNTFFTQP